MKWFLLNLNPEPWAIGPVGYSRRGGRMSAYVGRNQQLDAYKQAVKEELGTQDQLTGKIVLRFFFWRNRAEYTTPQARTHRKHEADLTNLVKSTEDALQGILFVNDKDVIDSHGVLVEQGPDVEGRIIIGVDSVPDLPDIMGELPPEVWELLDKSDQLVFDFGEEDARYTGAEETSDF